MVKIMRTDLQALIDTAKALSDRLDEAARQEQEFCYKLQLEFEQMSWEMTRMMDNLTNIQEWVG